VLQRGAGEGRHPAGLRGPATQCPRRAGRFSGSARSVSDGPFPHTGELVAGFWLWQVRSLEEAIEWVRRCPNPMLEDSEIEIRPLYEDEDLGRALAAEGDGG